MAHIVFFRHWPAKYEVLKQNVDKKSFNVAEFIKIFSNVFDLKSTEEVRDFVRQLCKNLNFLKYKKIHIWVSPFGRTIETARIIIEELKKHWIEPQKLHLFEAVEEVRWFSREIHQALCNGWWVKLKGWKQVFIQKEKTNPNNLPFSEYFFNDEICKIDKHYLRQIWLLDYVENVEKYSQIVKRSFKVLDRLLKNVWDDKLVIIVTHQAFTDEIIRRKRNYSKDWWLQPGEFLIVKSSLDNVARWKDFTQSWKYS